MHFFKKEIAIFFPFLRDFGFGSGSDPFKPGFGTLPAMGGGGRVPARPVQHHPVEYHHVPRLAGPLKDLDFGSQN